MKSKIFATLFALPFLAVGVWMGVSMALMAHDALRMQSWVAVEADVLRAGFETNPGEDADTYEAWAEYTYVFGGLRYRGDRVMIAGGGDNVGDFQQNLGRRLARAQARGESITVFVDPEAPGNSIVDRSFRWGLAGFKSIFVLVFGGVGLGLLIFTWRQPAARDRSQPIHREQPWLANDAWQTAEIRSDSKTSMWAAWAFAAFWNLVSAPVPFLLYDEVVGKENYIALIGLLFPLVGIGLIAWAIGRTREWRRFGPAPVVLDPFPGSIGGHVGGTIDLALPYDSRHEFRVTLTSIHSYESGSGDDKSRREKAEWQAATVPLAEPAPRGTRLTFRFDVPAGLEESDIDQDDSYYLWRLHLEAELPGTDLDRSYEIPVFATARESRRATGRALERARDAQGALDEAAARAAFDVTTGPRGRTLRFPPGRHLSASIGGLLVGLVFAGAGAWMITEERMFVFGGVFAAVGCLIALATGWLMLNSLEVRAQGGRVVTVRWLLGVPVRRREIAQGDIRRLEPEATFRTQSGRRHVVYYRIVAEGRSGRRLVVGTGFRGQSEARAAVRLLARELGMREPVDDAGPAPQDTRLGPEVLT
ncbi:MAG: DUF3592 domain-containing protein [Woeseiaceae bacterium]|nr:DUF3592 domain-containing protein [Woeseiaceae bacterium]